MLCEIQKHRLDQKKSVYQIMDKSEVSDISDLC